MFLVVMSRRALLAVSLALALPALPAAASDYYAGKSVELLIGAPPAGGYDIYARTIARHMSRHIPGNPTIIAKNMPGAGSLRAAGFIASVAPKDGTAVGGIMPGVIMGPLLDARTEGMFDATKVIYLGTANSGTRVCVARAGSKVQTFDDAMKSGSATFGGVSKNDSTRDYGFMLKNLAGAQFNLVTGYPGTADLALAMERGEIDGVCGWDWASFKSQRADWIRDGKVRVLLQVGIAPNDELTRMGVPMVMDFVKSPQSRAVVELIVSQQVFQRSYILPAGTPPEAVRTLRAAFDATMTDKQFLDDADKARIDVSPLAGDTVQALVAKLYATPKDVIEQARKAINP